MNRAQKAAVVDEIAGEIRARPRRSSRSTTAASRSLRSAELRAKLREPTLNSGSSRTHSSERAADKAGAEALKSMLVGPTALALVRGDAAVAAKALNDMARSLNILEFKGGLMNGATLSADDVRSIARLPVARGPERPARRHDRGAADRSGSWPERADRRARDPAEGDRRPGSREWRGAGREAAAERPSPSPRRRRARARGGRGARGRGRAEPEPEAGRSRGRGREPRLQPNPSPSLNQPKLNRSGSRVGRGTVRRVRRNHGHYSRVDRRAEERSRCSSYPSGSRRSRRPSGFPRPRWLLPHLAAAADGGGGGRGGADRIRRAADRLRARRRSR